MDDRVGRLDPAVAANATICDLPPEILYSILKRLSPKCLVVAAHVGRTWRAHAIVITHQRDPRADLCLSRDIMQKAASKGRVGVVLWLDRLGCPAVPYDLECAARHGHADVVAALIDVHRPHRLDRILDAGVMAAALAALGPAWVDRLCDLGCEWDSRTLVVAVILGDAATFHRAIARGCRCDDATIVAAVATKRLAMLVGLGIEPSRIERASGCVAIASGPRPVCSLRHYPTWAIDVARAALGAAPVAAALFVVDTNGPILCARRRELSLWGGGASHDPLYTPAMPGSDATGARLWFF
ncbi:F-box incomplete domain containing protein [Pandoravirus celtis]|uniref:F-box incomplete domain containing protein n=1 Tax=Pandoravirus celtis TaxID=2568002 RepID=A0A4D6EGX3_9VIRU|nr:F-box incomplete domain containing protein [Pandoravirus celtis]